MRHTISVSILICMIATAAGAQTFTSVQSGYWHDPATWGEDHAYPDSDGADAVVLHDVNVEGTNRCRDLTVAAGASVYTSYGYRTLNVVGSAIIDGDVFSSHDGWPLNVRFYGNLTLNGTLTTDSADFVGAGDQHVSLGDGAVLAPHYLWISGGGDLIADTDIRIDADCSLSGSTIVLTPGTNAEFLGGFVEDGSVMAGGQSITSSSGAWIANMSISNAVLRGETRVAAFVNFTGTTVVANTLQTEYGHVTATFDDLVNDGVIRDGDWHLDVRVLGDVVDNGDWTGFQLTFGGAGLAHAFSQAGGTTTMTDNIVLEAGTGTVTLHGSIELDSHIDLNGCEINLATGTQLTLAGGDLGNGRLIADRGTIVGVDGSYLADLEIADAVLQGVTTMLSNITFTGRTVNEGVLRNTSWATAFVTIDGGIVNRGSVVDNGSPLILTVTDDLDNEGLWTTQQTHLTGTGNQLVGASDAHPIGGYLRLYSHLGGTGHQWTLDGEAWPGFTTTDCDLSPANSAHHGVWQCTSSEGASRLITIGDPIATAVEQATPTVTSLVGSHPNPFNPTTEIHFTLASRDRVRLGVYDLQGRLVATLADGVMDGGNHAVARR